MENEQEVLEANQKFYQAFNRRDLDLMKEVWHPDDTVVCIHPGWEVLRGIELILQSWENIFVGSENLEIKLSDIEVKTTEGIAWVSCQENLFAMSMSGVQASKVHATNLFKRAENQWKMVLHHASAVPRVSRQEQIDAT